MIDDIIPYFQKELSLPRENVESLLDDVEKEIQDQMSFEELQDFVE